MSSDRQIKANKQNAQHSTGPRTENGKARVASNALKHGLTGKQVVLPGEDPAEFDAFRSDLIADLAPQGALEEFLAEKIVADAWRLRRVPQLEAALYRREEREARLEAVRKEKSSCETSILKQMQSIHESSEILPDRREAHQAAEARLREIARGARRTADSPDAAIGKAAPDIVEPRTVRNHSLPILNEGPPRAAAPPGDKGGRAGPGTSRGGRRRQYKRERVGQSGVILQNKPNWRCPKTVNLSDGSQLELNGFEHPCADGKCHHPDGSRARTKVTPAERTGITPWSEFSSGRSRNFGGSYSERRRLGRGTRPKLLYVLVAAALSARSGLSSRLGLLFCRWQVP